MTLNVYSDSGKIIDWWFMYKLPRGVESSNPRRTSFGKTKGSEYMYHDEKSKKLMTLSKYRLNQKKGALYNTLKQLYKAKNSSKNSLGWICYNDEIPGASSNSESHGHTKGVLAFDLESDTAFWLLHSWPKFPDIKTAKPGAWNYGQTFLCVNLKNLDAARSIAQQMYNQQEPQTYQVRLPRKIKKTDLFYKVAKAVDVNETDPPSDITFLSRKSSPFKLMAKNRHWKKDFWIDLVGPHLEKDIDVETWRRGTVPGTEDSDGTDTVSDILHIDLAKLKIPYKWHYTKDHAKWGVSEKGDWVCVADINRQTSQEKRGGGSICFQNKLLWKSLSELEKLK